MSKAWLLLLPLGGLLWWAGSKRARDVKAKKSSALPNPIIVTVPGYRRALDSELTDDMVSAAVRALGSSAPLGTVVVGEDFAIGIENHHNEARGWHRGASVFVPG